MNSAFRLLLTVLATVQLGGAALAVPISIAPDGSGGAAGLLLPLNPGPFDFGDTTFQQVTDFSAFSALGGPRLLTSIDFRNSGNATNYGQLLGTTLSIGVTPAAAGGLSTNLSLNTPNPLTLVASDYTLTAAAGAFNIHIDFATPFLYNPSAGNNLILQFFTPGAVAASSVNYRSNSPTSSFVYNSAGMGNEAANLAALIQYNFVDAPVAPELDAVHCLPAFLCVGLLGQAGQRRRAEKTLE